METFDPTGRIVHEVNADFIRPFMQKPVRLMQYDRSLPILAIKLYQDRSSFQINPSWNAKIRWSKPDTTIVYKDALGTNADRTIVYVELDYQMTYYYGEFNQVLELFVDENTVAGSAYLPITIDRNPIQKVDVESTTEWQELEQAVIDATAMAEMAEDARDDAADSASNAEGWAVGTMDGVPVEPSKPQYNNHSKYWAEQSQDHADEAEDWADRAEQAANKLGWMKVFIDERGHLIYVKTPLVPVDFKLVEGHLFSEVIG